MIQYLLLMPGAEPEVRNESLDYDRIVATVGYPVEVIHLIGGQATLYAKEQSLAGGTANDSATRLAVGQRPIIHGPALVVGPMGPGGQDTSLSPEALRTLMEALQ